MSPAAARSMATVLTDFGAGRTPKEGYSLKPRTGGRLDIVRMGAGVRVLAHGTEGEAPKTSTMTFTMIGDFGRALNRAADEAEAEVAA